MLVGHLVGAADSNTKNNTDTHHQVDCKRGEGGKERLGRKV